MLKVFVVGVMLACSAMSPSTAMAQVVKPPQPLFTTTGVDEMGSVAGVTVSAERVQHTTETTTRVLVDVVESSPFRFGRAYVAFDDISRVVGGIDSLMAIKANPTTYREFRVTFGLEGLLVAAENAADGSIRFVVTTGISAGSIASATLTVAQMRRLRSLISDAGTRLGRP